jgi:predicted acyltransferase
MPPAERPQSPGRLQRLVSIDALRGFDMFWIVGGDALIEALTKWAHVRWPDSETVGKVNDTVRTQLGHVGWEGFHFEDLIFPLFLFLVGVVLPFSMAKVTETGASRKAAYWRILRRTLLLYVLGLIYYGKGHNGLPGILDYSWAGLEHQRYVGVLQRIAICYGIAALISLWTRVPGQVVILLAILVGYWAILAKVPVPGVADPAPFSVEKNLSAYVDQHYLPGSAWVQDKEKNNLYDNEGLLSTLPGVATALLGVLAGQWLRSRHGALAKTLGLAIAGCVCLAAGLAWSGYTPPEYQIPTIPAEYQFPIIKNLWTSSYVLYAGGWSLILLALFYGVIDGLGWRWLAFFFVVIGANAITIYFADKIVNFQYTANYLFGGLVRQADADFRPVARALSFLAVEWLFLLILYRNRVFLRV